jgi:hypothetical protein
VAGALQKILVKIRTVMILFILQASSLCRNLPDLI